MRILKKVVKKKNKFKKKLWGEKLVQNLNRNLRRKN